MPGPSSTAPAGSGWIRTNADAAFSAVYTYEMHAALFNRYIRAVAPAARSRPAVPPKPPPRDVRPHPPRPWESREEGG